MLRHICYFNKAFLYSFSRSNRRFANRPKVSKTILKDLLHLGQG